MSKQIEIDVSKYFDNNPTKVTIKKLSYGEMCYIKDNAPMGINPLTKLPIEKEGEVAMMILQASLVSAPFMSGQKATMDEVKSIDFDLGAFLTQEALKLNGLTPKE